MRASDARYLSSQRFCNVHHDFFWGVGWQLFQVDRETDATILLGLRGLLFLCCDDHGRHSQCEQSEKDDCPSHGANSFPFVPAAQYHELRGFQDILSLRETVTHL